MTRAQRVPAGPAFPFRIAHGRVAASAGDAKIADDLRHLLTTRIGERLLRRGYGGGVHGRLHEPDDGTLDPLVRHEMELAIRTHLPQVRLIGPVRVAGGGNGELRILVDYRVADDEVARQLAIDVGPAEAP